jgi:peptidoglycan hydrolase-like protein with peptidoglycan-binding domain
VEKPSSKSKPSQFARGETESKPSKDQGAKAGEDRNSSGLGERSQQNRTTARRDDGPPKPSSAQPNQAQQDHAQLNGQGKPPGQKQQARDTMKPSPENGSAASGPVNLNRDEIRHVQMVLKEKGFDVSDADGVLGPRTRSALIAFQREQRLEPTGKIDPPTIIALELSNRADSTTSGPPLSAAGVAVSQDATPSLQAPDARMQAPIGRPQPRPSDLPPGVQRDEQLDPKSAQTQPQKQTPNQRSKAGSVPTIDFRKNCEISVKDIGPIFGSNIGGSLEACQKQEQEARQEMINSWMKYPPVDRQKCIKTRRSTCPAMSNGSPAWRCIGTLEFSTARRRASVPERDN